MPTTNDPIAASDVVLGIPVEDFEASSAAYRTLLGEPVADGVWTLANGRIELQPVDADTAVDFTVVDITETVHQLGRRGLTAVYRDDESYALEGAEPLGVTTRRGGTGAHIDHLVMHHPDIDGAVALYAGRLGLDLRRDRPLAEDVNQLFFRTASVVVEVVAGPKVADREPFGGIAWSADDIDAEQRRLIDAGLDVSEVRVGRKPGTRVCTLRNRSLGAPTLLIEQTPRA